MLNLNKTQYRRLRKAISQIRAQSKQQNESDILGLLDQMIHHCKLLANCILQYKKLLREKEDIQAKYQKVIQIDQKCQKYIHFGQPILSNYNYTKMFYLRLRKEMNYYTDGISIIQNINKDLQQQILQQCNSNFFSIDQIFRICQKKLLQQAKKTRNMIEICHFGQLQEIPKMSKQSSSTTSPDRKSLLLMKLVQKLQLKFDSVLSQKELQQLNTKQQQKPKAKLDFYQAINKMLKTCYKVIDIQSMQAYSLYMRNLSVSSNADIIVRKQMKRNNKIRKQINSFEIQFDDYLNKVAYKTKNRYDSPSKRNYSQYSQKSKESSEYKNFTKEKFRQTTNFRISKFSFFKTQKKQIQQKQTKSLKSHSLTNKSQNIQINKQFKIKPLIKIKNFSSQKMTKKQNKLKLISR